MYKIAILGCENSHADSFLDFIIKDKLYTDIEVVGVYSDDLEAAQKLNETYGVYVAKSYDEFVELIEEFDSACMDRQGTYNRAGVCSSIL